VAKAGVEVEIWLMSSLTLDSCLNKPSISSDKESTILSLPESKGLESLSLFLNSFLNVFNNKALQFWDMKVAEHHF
jgi:hypothetical protein